MRTFACFTKPLIWVVTLLMVALAAGCGGNLGGGNSTPSATKAITAYSVAWTAAAATVTGTSGAVAGVINETLKTIAVTVPYGTNVTALKATFTTTGASVKVGGVTQTSGTTANSFTLPVLYVVTAADGTWATYTVVVTVSQISAKAITSYTLAGAAGVINEGAKTIAVTKPAGTNVTALIATFLTDGASVKVAGATQTSGITANNFTSPVVYTVTAANNTTALYTVTVSTGAASSGVCSGAGCVPLGTAANYAIFANTAIDTTAAASIITGDIGAGPGVTSTAITGFALNLPAASPFSTSVQVSGKVYAYDYANPTPAEVGTASGDMGAAYTAAAAMAPAGGGVPGSGGLGTSGGSAGKACPGATGAMSDLNDVILANGDFLASGLPAGVYTCGGTAITIPDNLTLNGSATDVWVFRTNGTLDMTGAKTITLAGAARPENVFWQVAGAVTIGAGAHFKGIILGQTSITFGSLSTIVGRPLAQTAVTLNATTVTQP